MKTFGEQLDFKLQQSSATMARTTLSSLAVLSMEVL